MRPRLLSHTDSRTDTRVCFERFTKSIRGKTTLVRILPITNLQLNPKNLRNLPTVLVDYICLPLKGILSR